MRRLAIIPAKRRSRRLPEKNIRLFYGKPMFVYSIEAAHAAGLFSRIIVSTSDAEIAGLARTSGADVHIRDSKLEEDTVQLVDVCAAVIAEETAAGRDYDLVVVLLATAPMREAGDIAAVVALAERHATGSALAVTTFSHPAHQALKIESDGRAAPMWPDLVERREEELPQLRVDNGSTYAMHVASFLEEKTFYVKDLRAHEMPPHRSVDLDDESDLALLNYYFAQHADTAGKPTE